jgi:hypothetical protein
VHPHSNFFYSTNYYLAAKIFIFESPMELRHLCEREVKTYLVSRTSKHREWHYLATGSVGFFGALTFGFIILLN